MSPRPPQPPAHLTTPPLLDEWIVEAKQGALSWSELAERMLAWEHQPGRAHQPDRDRGRRCGFGEVIFGSGKSVADIHSIGLQLLDYGQPEVLVTRVEGSQAEQLETLFPHARYDQAGRTLRLSHRPIAPICQRLPADGPPCPVPPALAVVTAGSTDLPVAREALETLAWMGFAAELVTDVGVAGPYRLLAHLPQLRTCSVIVVVAGMEGALASVMGGLVPCPIIAVPTSVGYGANFAGMTTLLSMVSSCAAGVTVVNIDAGFKGGYVAGLIAEQVRTPPVSAAPPRSGTSSQEASK